MELLGIGIKIVETLLYIALPSFIVSTYYLVIVAKKTNMKLVESGITNPLFPNIDLNFFRKLQEEYKRQRSSRIPTTINKISFYIVVIGFISLFLMVIAQEFLRYH
ncbi:MAG TPA: hypothetical protein ENK84_12870 [Desulfobulbus sp.]|nr:hypothetical protein [Desulfobulbus sp.]